MSFQRPTDSLIQGPCDPLPTVSAAAGPVAASRAMFPIESVNGDPALDAPVSLGTTIMAMAYGDELTNMLQPFWALPLLGITGLQARDILPYTLVFMAVGAVIFSTFLLG